jgi:hypothetical protein
VITGNSLSSFFKEARELKPLRELGFGRRSRACHIIAKRHPLKQGMKEIRTWQNIMMTSFLQFNS